ncbi:uncharacterized protein LOC126108476 isoform X2 [Schistocerca cancellata]|uniref:uncharacterized protein LOC126108476 isoform X2 n=1 Tax=Schistocerca cancellata TaxID=274614 RepID=UPI0021192353|nr:uncharacterized protein LOC126108476 isoform X2 [Schistocerca cancellata]
MVQYCCCYGCKERYVKGGTVTFHSIWCISVVPPSAPKPEQTWPDDERNREITALVGESNIMPNDSATNKMQLGIATKKELDDRENRDYFLCGTVKQEQEYEHAVVKKEPEGDPDESMYSATEEECEHVVVKEEPMEEPDESVNSATEAGCEITIVKEEPADESTYAAGEEVCGRINVKVEQEPEYERNSCEEHRTQEPEYIEVKSEPLEAEEVTGDGATHWDSLCFW